MTSSVLPGVLGDAYRDAEWMNRAACREANPREFAPPISTPRSRHYAYERSQRAEAARQWCAGCPVINLCARAADVNAEVGLWGGALRRKDHNEGRYIADRLIPQAPPSRRVRNNGAMTAS